jgi:hypothetical protein
MQDGDEESSRIQGFWVKSKSSNSGIYFGYIPIKISQSLSDIEYTPVTLIEPLQIPTDKSELTSFQYMRKVAFYLKQYTLYEYSRDPENFGEDNFVIDDTHQYDINQLSKQFIPDNKIIYYDGKIIVPSEDIRSRLLNYLQVEKLNDHPGLDQYKNKHIVQNYYNLLSDFRKAENQLIFMKKKMLKKWKVDATEGYHNNIVTYFQPWLKSPYYYRGINIENGSLLLIQNVHDGSLERALEVSEKWTKYKDKINLGYYSEPHPDISSLSYDIYDDDGLIMGTGTNDMKILQYFSGDFAAILIL